MALSGKKDDRRVNDIGRTSGTAEFTAGTGEMLVKRHDFHLFGSQKARQCGLRLTVAPCLPDNARGHAKGAALRESPVEKGIPLSSPTFSRKA